eukprot:2624864-Pleurochrysis_carterae.AAC.2
MGLSGRSSSLSPFTRRTQNDLPTSMERKRASEARSTLPMALSSAASWAASVTRTSAALARCGLCRFQSWRQICGAWGSPEDSACRRNAGI